LNPEACGVFGLGYVIILKLGLFPTRYKNFYYPYGISTNKNKGGDYETIA